MVDQTQWDCVVVGGGPAASTFASIVLRYRPSTKILILEGKAFPRFHVGETLVSEINRILHEMGVYNAVDEAGFIRKYGATFRWGVAPEPWTMRFGELEALRAHQERFGPVQSSYTWHVDRPRYDHILLRHARALGAEVREASPAAELIMEDGRAAGVRLVDGSVHRARLVIDATGQSGFANGHAEREMDPRLRNVAYWGYFRGFRLKEEWTGTLGSSRAFIVAHAQGWSWYFPIRPDMVSVGVVTSLDQHRTHARRDPLEFYRAALAQSPELSELLRDAELVPYEPSGRLVHRISDFSYTSRRIVSPGFARIGDAAGFVDPILSVGCFLGQYSARLLAYAALSLWESAMTWDENIVLEAYADHVRDTLAAFRQITYFFYRYNERPDAWWACARSLVDNAGFPRAASDRQAFNAFVTGFAARRSAFREPTAVFDEPFFREAIRQLAGREQAPAGAPAISAQAVYRLGGAARLKPSAVPLDAQGRMAPALRVEISPVGGGTDAVFLHRVFVPMTMAPLFELIDGRRSVAQLENLLVDRLAAHAPSSSDVGRYTRNVLSGLVERGLAWRIDV